MVYDSGVAPPLWREISRTTPNPIHRPGVLGNFLGLSVVGGVIGTLPALGDKTAMGGAESGARATYACRSSPVGLATFGVPSFPGRHSS